jgi:hypothetical protein
MPKAYKVTPVEHLPTRRHTGVRSVYPDVVDDVLKTGSKFVKIELSGRKPNTLAAGLKDAISRDPERYGAFVVRQRGCQVFVERRDTKKLAA